MADVKVIKAEDLLSGVKLQIGNGGGSQPVWSKTSKTPKGGKPGLGESHSMCYAMFVFRLHVCQILNIVVLCTDGNGDHCRGAVIVCGKCCIPPGCCAYT